MHLGEMDLRKTQSGMALMALLLMLLVLSLTTQQVAFVLSEQAAREREQTLLQLGTLYAQAIRSYYEASPGAVKQLPSELSDLLEDKRFVFIKRHLRKPYKDPQSSGEDFGLIRAANGHIKGVSSAAFEESSKVVPPDVTGIQVSFSDSSKNWRFVYEPPADTSASKQTATPSAPKAK
jgi:type II secretory pathway pseudopilin PulG